jgi:hypothetical protein
MVEAGLHEIYEGLSLVGLIIAEHTFCRRASLPACIDVLVKKNMEG